MAELECRLVSNLRDAMIVRGLRNSCAEFLTNARDPIGRWAQAVWYVRHYRQAHRNGNFRVYLFSENRCTIGYGALKLRNEQLLVTECIASEHRGRGFGRLILHRLLTVARREGREVIAEIWTSNVPSIRLHVAAGFTLRETLEHQGSELAVYTCRST